jgi:hypothetical protein
MGDEKGFTKEQLRNFEKWWRQTSKKIEISDVAGSPRVGPPEIGDTPRFRPTIWPVPAEKFHTNLQKYVDLALSLGASDARAIATKEIPMDRRSYYVLCLFPNCRWLNTNANCPMSTMISSYPFEELKEWVTESFSYAIVFKVVPPKMDTAHDVGPINLNMYYTMGGGDPPDKTMLARNIIRTRILAEMLRRLRQAAFYDGYMMAAPISAAPCIVSHCSDTGKCPALEKGGLCRFVETTPMGSGAVYIDYHTLGRKLGWGELQVSGNCAFPENVPDPTAYYNIGLLLVD